MQDNILEYEKKRHDSVLKRINHAKNIKELPNITLSTITKYLVDNAYLENRHLNSREFSELSLLIYEEDTFVSPRVRNLFINILYLNYASHNRDDFRELYYKIANNKRIDYLLDEMNVRNKKIALFHDEKEALEHENMLKKINASTTLKELPKVNYGDLNALVQNATQNDIVEKIPMDKLYGLIYAIYNDTDIAKEVDYLCSLYNLKKESEDLMHDQIILSLKSDKRIKYKVAELKAKEIRKNEIFELEHFKTIEEICSASSLEELPKNISMYKLTSFLANHANIYSGSPTIKNSSFNYLASLLLMGKKIDSQIIKNELKKIVRMYDYKDYNEACELLQATYIDLAGKINYLVEEINLAYDREQDFTDNETFKNINFYGLETSLVETNGGVHFTLYYNELDNLRLEELAPNYKSLTPSELVYAVRKVDPTFKTGGGLILSKRAYSKYKNSNTTIKLYNRSFEDKNVVKSKGKRKKK